MLELGKAGAAGYPKGELPVLRDGSVVAVLRAANWKEAATAVVGDREWVFAKRKGELTGRWATEPEGVVRLRARQASFWRGTWTVDLEGRPVEVQQRLDVELRPPLPVRRPAGRPRRLDRRLVAAPDAGRGDPAIPLHQQVFLLWLELVVSRRNSAAVAGGASAAVIGGTS